MILLPSPMYTYSDFINILITINIQLILIAENLFPISNINDVAISKNTYLEDLFVAYSFIEADRNRMSHHLIRYYGENLRNHNKDN